MKLSTYRLNLPRADEYWTRALTSPQRVVSALLKIILLEHGDKCFYNGHTVYMKKRLLGAGVYEIWFEQEKEEKK